VLLAYQTPVVKHMVLHRVGGGFPVAGGVAVSLAERLFRVAYLSYSDIFCRFWLGCSGTPTVGLLLGLGKDVTVSVSSSMSLATASQVIPKSPKQACNFSFSSLIHLLSQISHDA